MSNSTDPVNWTGVFLKLTSICRVSCESVQRLLSFRWTDVFKLYLIWEVCLHWRCDEKHSVIYLKYKIWYFVRNLLRALDHSLGTVWPQVWFLYKGPWVRHWAPAHSRGRCIVDTKTIRRDIVSGDCRSQAESSIPERPHRRCRGAAEQGTELRCLTLEIHRLSSTVRVNEQSVKAEIWRLSANWIIESSSSSSSSSSFVPVEGFRPNRWSDDFYWNVLQI